MLCEFYLSKAIMYEGEREREWKGENLARYWFQTPYQPINWCVQGIIIFDWLYLLSY